MFFLAVAGGLFLPCQLARASDFPSPQVDPALSAGGGFKKILVFLKCSEYEDPMVHRDHGQPGKAESVLGDLGKENHILLTFTADGSVFTPETLASYDAICFFTSGDLTQPGADRNPPMTPEGKAALLQAIYNGKGFIGIHSAAATFQSTTNTVDPYIQMLGGEILVRVRGLEPAHQIIADTNFPGLGRVPANFAPTEEWYALRNYAADLHVLMVMDTASMVRGSYYAPDYPTTWARRYGRGRVFYTCLGHQKETWDSPVFKSILGGGLKWADGSVSADITPNMDRVAPQIKKP